MMKHVPHVLIMLMLHAALAFGQTFPECTDLYVNDFAFNLSADDTASIRQSLTKVYHDTRVEITLVTIRSLSDYGATDFSSYATDLFNKWSADGKNRDKGFSSCSRQKTKRYESKPGADMTRNMPLPSAPW